MEDRRSGILGSWSFAGSPIVMYSSVQKGNSPVLDADVKMIVEDSDGHAINVDLRDDGQGMLTLVVW